MKLTFLGAAGEVTGSCLRVDHEHGAWFRILGRDNRKLSDEKSPAGKVDYHTMGACYDIVKALEEGGHA